MPKLDEKKIPADFQRVVLAKIKRDLFDLDYKRSLIEVTQTHSQREVSHYVRVTQPTISELLKGARVKVVPVPDGFSGASPYEICQRYAAGEITREQLVDQLTRWPYAKSRRPEGYFDDLIVDLLGTFGEVVEAFHHGLIDGEVYDEILDAVADD